MTASAELTAVLLSLLPALGNVAGGLIAELTPISGTKLSLALHAAVGAILALVAVELMPRVIVAEPAWPMFVAFFAGGCFALGVDASVERISVMMDPAKGRRATGAWMIYFANAVDSLSDGIMLGAGSAIHLRLGVMLALGIVIVDLPEGIAVIGSLKAMGLPRGKRLLVVASFGLPVLAGALIGSLFLNGRSDGLKLATLAFTAGILTTVGVEQMLSEAHRHGTVKDDERETYLGALAILAGFALFGLISLGVG